MAELVVSGAERSILGSCPTCGEAIPSGYLLIEYRTSDGWPQMYAECPSCRDVVHPT